MCFRHITSQAYNHVITIKIMFSSMYSFWRRPTLSNPGNWELFDERFGVLAGNEAIIVNLTVHNAADMN